MSHGKSSPFPFNAHRCVTALAALGITALAVLVPGSGGERAGAGTAKGQPLQAPAATIQNAPARDYDLQHLAVTLTINPANRSFSGSSTNTLTPLKGPLSVIRPELRNHLKDFGLPGRRQTGDLHAELASGS
jgi:hypothetical protein